MSSVGNGYYVPCPLDTAAKLPIRNGKILVKPEECSMASRLFCTLGRRGGRTECPMCPHYNFRITLKPIGKPSDFAWLDELIAALNSTFDVCISSDGRWRGDCCIDHKDVIVCKFNVEYKMETRTYLNKNIVQSIYNLVKDYANSAGSPHRLLHMRWSGHFFTLGLAPK